MPGGRGTTTTKDCSGKVACISDGAGGQSCFDSSAPTDTDFGTVIATTELAREAGVYENGLSIFSGADESCESKRYGIPTKCCRTSGGSKSNHDIMSGMVSQVLGNVGSYAWSQGSKYVYDFMYQSSIPWLQDRAIDAMTSVGSCFSDFSLAGGDSRPLLAPLDFQLLPLRLDHWLVAIVKLPRSMKRPVERRLACISILMCLLHRLPSP